MILYSSTRPTEQNLNGTTSSASFASSSSVAAAATTITCPTYLASPVRIIINIHPLNLWTDGLYEDFMILFCIGLYMYTLPHLCFSFCEQRLNKPTHCASDSTLDSITDHRLYNSSSGCGGRSVMMRTHLQEARCE